MKQQDKIQEIAKHIVTEERYLDICNTYGGEYKEDLYQEFIITIMSYKKIDKLYDIYKRKELPYFACTIIKTMATSNTSPFYKKIRGFSASSSEYNVNILDTLLEEDTLTVDTEKDLQQVLTTISDNLIKIDKWMTKKVKKDAYFFYNRELFDMYYYQNLTYKDIEKLTGIKSVSAFHNVKSTVNMIQEELGITPVTLHN